MPHRVFVYTNNTQEVNAGAGAGAARMPTAEEIEEVSQNHCRCRDKS